MIVGANGHTLRFRNAAVMMRGTALTVSSARVPLVVLRKIRLPDGWRHYGTINNSNTLHGSASGDLASVPAMPRLATLRFNLGFLNLEVGAKLRSCCTALDV
jgi:hypothetical protein